LAGDAGATGGGLHLIKLCVGAGSVEDLADWQKSARAQRDPARGDRRPVHVTRMFPRRAAEVLDGGSLYWVVAGSVCVRQRVLDLEPVTDAEGVRRCAIVLDPDLVRTEGRPRKPFQGWRYLTAADAPPDLTATGEGSGTGLPAELERTLGVLGLREK
jgi:hypothetical protein